MSSKKGFTLLEVLIVVIIIGILASLALPNYITSLEKARSGEAVTNVGSIKNAIDRYWYENGNIQTAAGATITTANLDVTITSTLYAYVITDDETDADTLVYTITATRNVGATAYTVTWIQESATEGHLYRSLNLGGPVAP
ncbi:MAG: prepilin-type N-terminal cleavage/methylation domain-containing protein [Candidatus Omnitrophota bacterium]|nr:prepilin-type N-terminal cleavage/methylation domain-containing protein [Candidatus Omnitrophota bacterium]